MTAAIGFDAATDADVDDIGEDVDGDIDVDDDRMIGDDIGEDLDGEDLECCLKANSM